MRDSSTPVDTPFSLANGPSTPYLQRSVEGVTPAHEKGSSTDSEGLPSIVKEENKSEGLLLEKLVKAAAAHAPTSQVSSPFDLIPNEILSLILEHGYFCTDGPPDKRFRELVGNISLRFRRVALQTPSLWACVHLAPSNVFDELELLPFYLYMSKSHPLDIHFSCFWAPDVTEQIMKLMIPHSIRWKHLSISIMNDHALKFLAHVAAPSLTMLVITFYSNQRRVALPSSIFRNSLPQLQFLCLRNVDLGNIGFTLRNIQHLDIRGHGTWPTFNRLKEMLGQATNLRRLILHVKPGDVLTELQTSLPGTQPGTLGQICLPALECLMFYTSEWLTQDMADFIKLFNSPKLKVLVLHEGVSGHAERASAIMTYLVQVKDLSPFTLEPVWTALEHPATRRTKLGGRVVQPTLWVKLANLYHAWSAVRYSIASQLTALDLYGVMFPRLARMKEVFASLKNLQYLSILDLDSSASLSSIRDHQVLPGNMAGMVDIPSLTTLVLAFRRSFSTPFLNITRLAGVDTFLKIFNLPSLSFLLLKNLTLKGWYDVVDVFRQGGVQTYPKLTSLKIVNMEDSVHLAAHGHSPVGAFPRLEWLLLDGVASTGFLQCFLEEYHSTNGGAEPVWPNLTSLVVTNDPCLLNRPLLHRVICAREAFARPLRALYVDSTFTRNMESYEWVKARVSDVMILPPRDPKF